MFFKTGFRKHFAIFMGKQLYWSLFLLKETPTQVFSCEYCKISKSSFFYRTPLVATSELRSDVAILYFDNSHANQANATKKIRFSSYIVNIIKNLKKTDKKKCCFKCI